MCAVDGQLRGRAVREAKDRSVGGLMGRLSPRTMPLQWGWGLHEWPEEIVGPAGMFSRWVHTWYFCVWSRQKPPLSSTAHTHSSPSSENRKQTPGKSFPLYLKKKRKTQWKRHKGLCRKESVICKDGASTLSFDVSSTVKTLPSDLSMQPRTVIRQTTHKHSNGHQTHPRLNSPKPFIACVRGPPFKLRAALWPHVLSISGANRSTQPPRTHGGVVCLTFAPWAAVVVTAVQKWWGDLLGRIQQQQQQQQKLLNAVTW